MKAVRRIALNLLTDTQRNKDSHEQ